jgi:hypothetical protein
VTAVVVVVPLAFLIPGDTGTRLVATLAFVVALGKSAYDVWDKERERIKKAEETREKVTATVRFGCWDTTGHELGVVLYNDSPVTPVHIQSVVCYFKPPDAQAEESLRFANMKYGSEELLLPKHTARFRDSGFKKDFHAMLLTLPENNLWISVTTYQGEVCRVEGKEIQAVLKAQPTNR